MTKVSIPQNNQAYNPGNKFTVEDGFGPRGGRNHNGVDFPADEGTPIPAAADGKVVGRGFNEEYGNMAIIQHQDPKNPSHHVYSIYAHMPDINNIPPIGTELKKGDKIGEVGSTGRSSDPHLHFELVRIRPGEDYYSTWPGENGWQGGATNIPGGHGRLDPMNQSNWGGIETHNPFRPQAQPTANITTLTKPEAPDKPTAPPIGATMTTNDLGQFFQQNAELDPAPPAPETVNIAPLTSVPATLGTPQADVTPTEPSFSENPVGVNDRYNPTQRENIFNRP